MNKDKDNSIPTDTTTTLRLKQVMHLKTAEICKCVQDETGIIFDKQAIAAISEIAFRQVAVFTEDLEAFRKHGKRKRISVEDVLLLARKVKPLQQHLAVFNQSNNTS